VDSEDIHISVSQIKSYLLCSRAFDFRYRLGATPEHVPVPMAFGLAIHAALAAHYEGIRLTGSPPSYEEVTQVFRDAWAAAVAGPIPLQASNDDEVDDDGAHVDKGIAMLTAFRVHAATVGPVVVRSVEQRFSVPLFHPQTGEVLDERLSGVVDLVVEEEGRNVVIDHKSSARKFAADQLRYDFQLTAYQLAARELELGDVGLRYQILTKTKKPAVYVEEVRRDEQDEADFLSLVVGVLAVINAGLPSYPLRGWQCRSCPYQAACSSKR
jgi:CRISPR/Cas system-associated exonuclease Cas4 (RecB family)